MRLNRIQLGLLAVLLILATAYWLLTRPWPVASQTTEEKQKTDKLFEQTKPQCIGRYVFDVPASFTNVLADQVMINDVRIASKRLYRPAFEQRIRLREQELNNKDTVNPRDLPFLKQVYRINENTVIFDRNENESVPGFGRILEGHLYNNGVAFTLITEITDLSDSKYHKYRENYVYSGTKENDLNDKPQKLAELQSLLSRLSGRTDDSVPTQPGTCISQGFIVDDNVRRKEQISLRYDLDNFFLSIKIDNTPRKEPGLLDRANEINAVIIRTGAHTLKKGKIPLPDIDASEWLMTAKQEIYRPEDKVVPYYNFFFYGNEKNSDYRHPVLSLQMHNRGQEIKTYTGSQLVAIWDRITRTFRYRPNAF